MPDSPHGWKRIIVRTVIFGGSAGTIVVIGAIAVFWYLASLPVAPPKAWNTKAITATYMRLGAHSHEGIDKKTKDYIEFYYTLQNHTDNDYSVSDDEILCGRGSSSSAGHEWKLVARLAKEQSIVTFAVPEILCLADRILLPARQRASFVIRMLHEYPTPTPSPDAPKQIRDAYRANLTTYMNEHATIFDGFAIYDTTDRFEIDLPGGWKK
jgi:hypothetical protein